MGEGVPLLQQSACAAEGIHHAVGHSHGESVESGVGHGCSQGLAQRRCADVGAIAAFEEAAHGATHGAGVVREEEEEGERLVGVRRCGFHDPRVEDALLDGFRVIEGGLVRCLVGTLQPNLHTT